jgi:hypothetical protein
MTAEALQVGSMPRPATARSSPGPPNRGGTPGRSQGRNGRTAGGVPSEDGITCRGFNINTVGIILMVGGLLGLFASLLFWSSVSPWSRRRTVASDAVVEERRIERDLP